ncbi:hypothetical protein ACFPRL_22740 [Pseudoclavibacter helvolus]
MRPGWGCGCLVSVTGVLGAWRGSSCDSALWPWGDPVACWSACLISRKRCMSTRSSRSARGLVRRCRTRCHWVRRWLPVCSSRCSVRPW